MDGKLSEVEQGLDRVQKKQKTTYAKTTKTIDKLLDDFYKCKNELSADRTDTPDMVSKSLTELSKAAQGIKTLQTDMKEHHAVVSKMGKALDKVFKEDTSKAISKPITLDSQLLDKAVAQHLFRQGRFDIGEVFVKEAKVDLGDTMKEPFLELFQIVEAIKAKNLIPALQWAHRSRDQLKKTGSLLEFQLHKLQFLQLLATKTPAEALAYSRTHFSAYATTNLPEIQKLMGCFLYAGRLQHSPYADLFAEHHWMDVQTLFTKTCCSFMGMATDSPLSVCVTAGNIALPHLLKAQVIKGKVGDLPSGSESVLEVPLPSHLQFHTTFSCPVSREQCTPENPPVLLPCGHVIGQGSMLKLGRGSSRYGQPAANPGQIRFKCPYCPTEATPGQALQLYF